MNLTTNTIIILLVIIFLLILLLLYLSRYEGYDNLDEVLQGVKSCDDPKTCHKTNEEINKEAVNNPEKSKLTTLPITPSQITSVNVLLTLTNNTLKEVTTTIPKKDDIAPPIRAIPGAYTRVSLIRPDYKPKLKEKKVLSSSGSHVYMLDVDPNKEGILKQPEYNITTLSMAHPDSLLKSTFLENIPKYNTLYDIYNKKKQLIRSVIPSLSINHDNKYNAPVNASGINYTINLDKGKHNNNFIIISPKTNSYFPDDFEIIIENNTTKSGFQIELWGNSFYNKNKPKPTITNKLITPKELIDFYTNKDYTRSFRTNTKTFDTCKSDYCMLGSMELGKRIINILETGNIVDESNIVIGNTTKTLFTEENHIEKFNIKIEKANNINSIILYTAYPVTS